VLLPGFATLVQARRNTSPKQVRHPTDRQFASGYSPTRLATTQLPSATELWPTPTGTFTLQIVRIHGRTLNRSRGRGGFYRASERLTAEVLFRKLRSEVFRLVSQPEQSHEGSHSRDFPAAYGAGLRASEVSALKVGDVDSTRMTLRIQQGKGGKDRYAMLSPVMLERLRTWWRVARAQGKMLDGGWLFPGLNPVEPLSTRQLNRAVHEARLAARIDKQVSMHTLRHYVVCPTIFSQNDSASCFVGNLPCARRWGSVDYAT
jgi:integrase